MDFNVVVLLFVCCFNHVRHTGDHFYGSFKTCVEIDENLSFICLK